MIIGTSILFVLFLAFLVYSIFVWITLISYYNGHYAGYVPHSMIMGLVCLFISLFILHYYYQKWYIETYYYNVTDMLLIVRKGVFAPREITVPTERIQDVYVDQDILDRLLDIYDVHISTATAESTARAHIDGVSKQVAEQLRELILGKL